MKGWSFACLHEYRRALWQIAYNQAGAPGVYDTEGGGAGGRWKEKRRVPDMTSHLFVDACNAQAGFERSECESVRVQAELRVRACVHTAGIFALPNRPLHRDP